MDHSHNIQICAGCIAGDLRIVLRRLQDHNLTLGQSQETMFASDTVAEILELIEDAQTYLTAQRTETEACLGTPDLWSDRQLGGIARVRGANPC